MRGFPPWLGHAGDSRDLRAVLAAGIEAVVGLAANEPPMRLTRDLTYLRLPLMDGSGNPSWMRRLAVDSVPAPHTAFVAHAATLPPDQRNLGTVRKDLFSDDVVYNLAVVLDTVGKSMNQMARDQIAAFLQTTDGKRSGMLATAQAYLKPFLSPPLSEALANSSVPLADVVAGEPMTIYLVLPPDKLKSHKALLKRWAGTLLKALTSRTTVPARRTRLLLDEAAQLGNFPPLETAVTLCAGYGLQGWTFWQDLAQLKSCYPDSWRTALNNCAVLQTFGINNRQMASQWGDHLGRGAAELAALPADRQVVAVQGSGEACCRRADYLRDPTFTALFGDNPLYGRTGPTTGAGRET